MSKEKQIEEMAKVIDQAKYDMWVGKAHQGGDFTNHSKNIAKYLYNAGYRKQSEGEWIVCGTFDDFIKCSSCGNTHPWFDAIEYKYCPRCGARMKGR